MVAERLPTRLVLKGESEWETPDLLTASVEQEVVCVDGYREKISTVTIESRETKNIALQATLGVAVAAAGAIALAVAPQVTDAKGPSDQYSPRENTQAWGIVGAGIGGVMVGHAALIAFQGRNKESEPTLTEEVRSTNNRRPCGRTPAGEGKVVASIGDRSVQLGAFENGGSVSVNLRTKADQLCDQLDNAKREAVLEYVLDEDSSKRVQLARYALNRCVTATVAAQRLTAAGAALDKAVTAQQVSDALRLLTEGESLADSLPARDPQRSNLLARAEKLKGQGTSKARAVLEPLVKQTLESIGSGADEAVAMSVNTLAVAQIANARDATVRAVYETFARRGKEGDAKDSLATVRLLDADLLTRNCLEEGKDCGAGMTQEQLKTLLEPQLRGAASSVSRQATQLSAASKALGKDQGPKSVKSFDAAVTATRPSHAMCLGSPIAALKESCQQFRAADSTATEVAGQHQLAVERSRKELADRERAESLKRASQAWRKHFAECRRMRTDEAALDQVSHCDAGCQKVVARMAAKKRAMQSFSVDELVTDEKVLSTLRRECRESECDVCP